MTSGPHPLRPVKRGSYNREPGASIERDRDRLLEFQLEVSTGTEDGPAWRAIRDDAWVYAQRTVRRMILQGVVWQRYHELGQPQARDLRMPARGVNFDDAHTLASLAVERAIPVLRQQLLDNKWSPDRERSASINTWTVNLAVLCLRAPWRAWRRDQRAQPSFVPLDPDREIDLRDRPEACLYTLEFERHVELLGDPDLSLVVRLDAADWEDAQIADHLDRSRKSIEYMLAKARRLGRSRRDHENLRDRDSGVA